MANQLQLFSSLSQRKRKGGSRILVFIIIVCLQVFGFRRSQACFLFCARLYKSFCGVDGVFVLVLPTRECSIVLRGAWFSGFQGGWYFLFPLHLASLCAYVVYFVCTLMRLFASTF